MNDSFILRRMQDSNLQICYNRWFSKPFDNHCPILRYFIRAPLMRWYVYHFYVLTQFRPNLLVSADTLGFYFFLSPVQYFIIIRFLFPTLLIFLTTNNKVVFISTPTKNRTWNIGLENRGYIHLTMEATISLGKGYLQIVAESFV